MKINILFSMILLPISCIVANAQDLKVLTNTQLSSGISQSKEISSKPQPLTQVQKLQTAQQILSRQGENVSSLSNPITLNVTNLSVKNRANLVLFKPVRVIGWEGGEAKFSGSEGNLSVEFAAQSSGKYLIDLAIFSGSDTKFTLTGKSNILTTAGSSAKSQRNLSFIIEAKQANENIYFQLAGDKVWIFFSCEISQIK